jgi:hypothetical protein
MTNIIVTLKHDTGKVRIKVFANSIDEAINRVTNAENAPKSAVIKAVVEKPTIYDIKRLTEDTSPYFFSRRTLQFFQQRVSDFKVYRAKDNKFLISAPRHYGMTERLFNPFTNELELI